MHTETLAGGTNTHSSLEENAAAALKSVTSASVERNKREDGVFFLNLTGVQCLHSCTSCGCTPVCRYCFSPDDSQRPYNDRITPLTVDSNLHRIIFSWTDGDDFTMLYWQLSSSAHQGDVRLQSTTC